MDLRPNEELLLDEIVKFLNKHSIFIHKQKKQLNELFEMAAYNFVITFYQKKGFKVLPMNTKNGEFNYKLQPFGHPMNFSWFVATKIYRNNRFEFEIHHNLPIEAVDCNQKCFLTPDVSVIKKDSITKLENSQFLLNRKNYYYVKNSDLQTFCEAKYLNPFPELLFNFIGMLLALKTNVRSLKNINKSPNHMAPSLLLAGLGNHHNYRIQGFLVNKYEINIFFGLPYLTKTKIRAIKMIPSN